MRAMLNDDLPRVLQHEQLGAPLELADYAFDITVGDCFSGDKANAEIEARRSQARDAGRRKQR